MKFSEGNPVVTQYVKALYDVAMHNHREDGIAGALKEICALISSQHNHLRLLTRLSLMPKEAVTFVEIIAESIECPIILKNFLKLLAENKRFALIEQIAVEYAEFLKDIKGTKTVYVTYAKDFDEKDQAKLENQLKEVFKCDCVECVLKQDSTLLGGIQIMYKSRMLDYSLKSKLSRLRETIRRSNYAN